ncbi:hypothetical protein [Anaerocolumna sp. MB42-C2]|uniref:hypothetical protein n=1 Tax=Anaerocolumna sp. MB42-C2 TaxID=3070997 RepID=UPI0027E095B9|nr:hypothetical protein [Anaerocolumna sp. MB42-C2]WMJ88606.1 hypothetical protein RBU59_03565 [Anaerocolumna sp. MB42-C2]
MNIPNKYKKLLIAVALVIVVTIIIAVIIFAARSRRDNGEKVAKTVLTLTYGATVKDYEYLTNTLTQSLKNNKILFDYLRTVYGERLTENGYKIFLDNRIPSIAANTAHKENSDLKLSTIKLEPKDALEGSKRYAFTIQVQTEKDVSKTITFKGSITLIRENGHWKVDGVSPN